jgi:hypothetical protein
MNNNNKNNSIYGNLDSNDKIVEWITKTLSTSKKFINANYTKNNFAKLKSDYPDIWEQIKNKTVEYINKNQQKCAISFIDRIYTPLTYNGIVVSTKNVWKNKNIHILNQNTNNSSSFKDIVRVCAENNLSGIQLFKIAKKAFPDIYIELQKIRKKCSCDREAIYCYFHNIDPLICNNKRLPFQTLAVGYSYQSLAQFSNTADVSNLLNFVKTLNEIDYSSVIHFVETYYPKIYKTIIKQCPAKTKAESFHMFIYEKDKPDECLLCSKRCNFKTLNWGYYNFCSEQCARVYTGTKNRKFRDPQKWNEYKMLVEYYTNISYKQYKTIINPKNRKRGIKEFHLDHIVPKVYGFEHNIDPKRIGHFKNLQMLTSVENNKKHAKVEDEEKINLLLELTLKDLEYLSLHD